MAANLLEKQDRRRPDPYHTIPLLSRGRTAVYSVWLICNELDKGSFEDLYAGPSAVFDELAADGLDLIGAPRCAAALRTAKERISDMEGHAEELAELHARFSGGGRGGTAARPMRGVYPGESPRIRRPESRLLPETRGLWPRDGDREDPAARWILAGLAGKRQDIDEMEEVYDHHTQRTLFTAKRRLRSPPARRLSETENPPVVFLYI